MGSSSLSEDAAASGFRVGAPKRLATSRLLVSVFCLAVADASAGDWPMYRADAGRSGYTAEPLPAKLSLHWVHRAAHAPEPAWPLESRLAFDRADQPVVANGSLFFGSSADCKVHALDAATGAERWAFFTDAPVRFAPVAWQDRVFAVGDDGWLYCLGAADGKLLWRRRGGPECDMVLGNGRMISRRPARGGPALLDGVLYFGAGIWPSEGVYLYALDAETGKELWRNESAGDIEMFQPHPTARARSGISAQGYLAASGDRLFVPTGRAVPAALRRSDGKPEYFFLQKYGKLGGAATVAARSFLFNGDAVFDAAYGRLLGRGISAAAVAATPDEAICATGEELVGINRAKPSVAREVVREGKKKRVEAPNPTWAIPAPKSGNAALIVAGRTAIVGGPDKVTAVDLESRAVAWTAAVEGIPYGLAAAGGRLYVSTDRGILYCFGADAPPAPRKPTERVGSPYGDNAPFAAAAEEVVQHTGIREGFCLDLGCGDGRLAFELARRTKLQIYGIDPDPASVAAAREKLDAAGLYGVRITVHLGDPARTPYPRYFANLAVSGRSVTDGGRAAVRRELRPWGGTACVGRPGAMETLIRGPLEGAGSWTHQYADPANTCCSSDTLARGPLGMLWFGSPDLRTPNRHGRPPAPLFLDGRLVVEGVDALRALDAYNGRVLWEFPVKGIGAAYHQEHLMGTSGTNSNFCLSPDSVYVAAGGRCLRVDAATGQQVACFDAPARPDGKPSTWGYIAWAEGTLFGTLANEEHLVPYLFGKSDMRRQFTESTVLFTLDAHTGEPKWAYSATHSIRHNAIAIGGGRVYLIDRPLAVEAPRGKRPATPHPTGELIALDAATGKILWRAADGIYGTLLALSTKHDALLMSYQPTAFQLSSETGGRMAAFRASTGERRWDRTASYRSRPVLAGRTLIAQPGAWDLLTGEPKLRVNPATKAAEPWRFDRSYGCGILSASPNLLLFRSATIGYVDLLADRPTANYGGIRPGCWISALPAGGLVLVPDLTNVCTCSYLNKASIALQPMD